LIHSNARIIFHVDNFFACVKNTSHIQLHIGLTRTYPYISIYHIFEFYILKILHFCFVHPSFGLWFLRQSYKNTKILPNLCLHFARQKENGKKITQLKLPKTKRRKYGTNEKLLLSCT
jgi:hypothetical protein